MHRLQGAQDQCCQLGAPSFRHRYVYTEIIPEKQNHILPMASSFYTVHFNVISKSQESVQDAGKEFLCLPQHVSVPLAPCLPGVWN